MKTPRFWYPRSSEAASSLLAGLLSPLSLLFRAGTFARRALAHPYRAGIPLVCVGNVVAGGAGKTPTCIALARIMKEHGQRPVFVTRGYGGKGAVVCVEPGLHQAKDVGDEALLLAAHAPVWAGRDRAAAIRQAESHGSVIIMDDGFQNPHLAPHASVLVVDGEAGLGNGRIVPAGPLRENFAEALKRAAALVMIGEDKYRLAAGVNIPVFHARLAPRPGPGFPPSGPFVAFAGIGRPEKFFATARSLGLDLAATLEFPDHHLFSEADIDGLRLLAEEKGAHLLTTEKDAVRLPEAFRSEPVTLPVALVFEDAAAEKKLARTCLKKT